MKVLYVGLARTLWMFDFSLFNPRGVSLQPMFEQLKEKYQFAKAPKNPLDFDEQRNLTFKSGTFVNPAGVPVIVGFTIYNNGVTADTLSSTDDSTEFLVQTFDWIHEQFGLKLPSSVNKSYLGQMDFESEAPLVALNPQLPKLLKFLEARYRPLDGKSRQFDVGGLNFWTEDVNQLLAPAICKIERKMGAPFSTNHYFSQTPLETKAHIEFLNELERVLSS
jgi:hypothetical protein